MMRNVAAFVMKLSTTVASRKIYIKRKRERERERKENAIVCVAHFKAKPRDFT